MKLLIEGCAYPIARIKELFPHIDELDVVEEKATVNYVGYYYHTAKNLPVFILPKVVIDKEDNVFGVKNLKPEDIIDLDDPQNPLTQNQRRFIYGLSVWIYRAIAVYRNSCILNGRDCSIVRRQNAIKMGQGRHRTANTFLDIILSLLAFHQQNREWFMFVVKNNHSGFNKINWNRTIAKSEVVIQDNDPVYLNPITKKRHINFDEELLVIFYSILNYIKETYGFPVQSDMHYELLTGRRFERYMPHQREDGTFDKGLGVLRLRQIKYKYFSDKALQLWSLCFAFFDQSRNVRVQAQLNEFLLVKNFNIVFEAIIDELIGDAEFSDRLNKKQADGKEVDHIYEYNSLTSVEPDKKVYYIGDSKYYKIGNCIPEQSVAKQYTYARNVIQWNLDWLFGKVDGKTKAPDFCLRDELTEGYNIIPNFFISAMMPNNLSYSDTISETNKKATTYVSQQFHNRLFDRDTLLVTHYDVNFLYVVSLYARNNALQKKGWRDKVRAIFRQEIQTTLNERYKFYAMRAKAGINTQTYIETHFRDILGKVYTPYEDKGVLALALSKDTQYEEENDALLSRLEDAFTVQQYCLGTDPRSLLPSPVNVADMMPGVRKFGALMVMMENYESRFAKFKEAGKIAVPVSATDEGVRLVERASNIGLVMFHTWNQENQHLFKLRKDVQIVVGASNEDGSENDSLKDYIRIVEKPTPPNGIFFALLDIDTTKELDSSALNCKNMPTSPKSRYYPLFASLEELARSNPV